MSNAAIRGLAHSATSGSNIHTVPSMTLLSDTLSCPDTLIFYWLCPLHLTNLLGAVGSQSSPVIIMCKKLHYQGLTHTGFVVRHSLRIDQRADVLSECIHPIMMDNGFWSGHLALLMLSSHHPLARPAVPIFLRLCSEWGRIRKGRGNERETRNTLDLFVFCAALISASSLTEKPKMRVGATGADIVSAALYLCVHFLNKLMWAVAILRGQGTHAMLCWTRWAFPVSSRQLLHKSNEVTSLQQAVECDWSFCAWKESECSIKRCAPECEADIPCWCSLTHEDIIIGVLEV